MLDRLDCSTNSSIKLSVLQDFLNLQSENLINKNSCSYFKIAREAEKRFFSVEIDILPSEPQEMH